MTDRSRILLSAVAGALVGGAAGFFLWTERGRRARAEAEPYLGELAKSVEQLQALASRARDTADGGWRHLESLMGSVKHASSGEVRRH